MCFPYFFFFEPLNACLFPSALIIYHVNIISSQVCFGWHLCCKVQVTPALLLNASSSLGSNCRQVRLKVMELDSEFCTQIALLSFITDAFGGRGIGT